VFWRVARNLMILSPAFALLGAGVWFIVTQFQQAPTTTEQGGRLVVVVVIDQFRGDYLTKFGPLFAADGFTAMQSQGIWYDHLHHTHASSLTGPGHATIATGVNPNVHGIVGNDWFDRTRNQKIYSASGDRAYERVPLGTPSKVDGGGLAPERLLVPTVGDVLVASKQGRVFSLALKDRTAILLGGKQPSGAYFYDPKTGEFVTTTFYRERLPGWVEQFNRAKHVDKWLGKPWERLSEEFHYKQYAGLDAAPGERLGLSKADHVFPHGLGNSANADYFTALEGTPMANELLWKLGQACIEAENLGQAGGTDLLWLGLSANDIIGHAFGPDSHEVLDATLRTDRLIAEILKTLEQKLGTGRYTLIVTSDHGICPLPETGKHPEAERFDPLEEYCPLNTVLNEKFGTTGVLWVERIEFPWVYFNNRAIDAHKIARPELEEAAAQWAANRPNNAEAAFGRTALAGPPMNTDLGRMVQRSFHPDRSGDVYLVNKPFSLPLGKFSVGTTHGTPHPYDTHITLLVYGHKVPARGLQAKPTSSLIVALVIAHALGLEPVATCAEKLPTEWVE
jgi:Type I phosphodiesterase / nucleotide pyrophosphatase